MRLGVIDVGSNTVHLLVVDAHPGASPVPYHSQRATLRRSLSVVWGVGLAILGLVLVVGAVLLWRAHRAARIVIGAAVALLALSSLARMVVDSVTFISVVGTVLSLLALTAMGFLLVSPGVRDHVREGVPLRLR